MRRRIVSVLVVLGVAGVLAWGSLTGRMDWPALRSWLRSSVSPIAGGQAGALVVSGSIEADEVWVNSEVGGRVVEVGVGEGDEVQAGQLLIRLDDTLLTAQIDQAEAAVAAARADLARVQAGPRAASVAAAQAGVAQAQARLDGARRAQSHAEKALAERRDIAAREDAARSQLAQAQAQWDQAQAQAAAARVLRDSVAHGGSDEAQTRAAIYGKQIEAAEAGMRAAEAARQGARETLAALARMREKPLTLQARARSAAHGVRIAEAALAVAQAELALAQAGPRAEAVAVAEANLRQAEAARALLLIQRDRLVLRSPLAGTVTRRAIRPGEVAAPGAALLTIANLDEVRLVVYVPTDRLGQVRLGQEVRVTVDAYPGRAFQGEVSYISPQAEFTPKNVQTQAERVQTVFAVRIRLPNPDHALKPGMPAEATLVE
jgi:HlyD family secretion protein